MALDLSASSDFARLQAELPGIRAVLRELELDGWLLYDLHARNAVSGGLVGLGDLTRRWFVWIPAKGEPTAIIHGIELGPWALWPWSTREYVGWRSLETELARTLRGTESVAMEISRSDAVPALDLVPLGVAELVERMGPTVVTSAELVSRFYSAWDEEGRASHLRAAKTVADVAARAFHRAAEAARDGAPLSEGELRRWIIDALGEGGLTIGADTIVAIGPNAADPHYAPGEKGALIERGQTLLIDLWGKESEDAVYADQTWMGHLGAEVPGRVAELFAAIRDGRDAAVELLRERADAGEPTAGWEVDDATRAVVRERGWGDAFVHRTGHSIDRDLHGTGPNIDDLETHETRILAPGVGFSIEPGIYLRGNVGLRTEINVWMGEDGPEVTTPDPQDRVLALPEADG
ncbi:MAG TPA: M24 family metallopeptidase [Longimicrobiales bacterium]|nr:M24 family metallopeptidase [Longimicrobiales bacterium]